MNVLSYLIEQFIDKEKSSIVFLFILSILNNIAQSTIISFIGANLIESIEQNKYSSSIQFMYQFIGISILFLIFYYIYKIMQNNILTNLTQWLKKEILRIILLSNNENMKQVNFIEFITPITRISGCLYTLFYNCINIIIPLFAFLITISLYFLYNSTILGGCFIISNIIIFIYLYSYWNDLLKEKNINETKINENEKYIIDILNNIDKVIYRGQTINEINNLTVMTDDAIKTGIHFLSYTTRHLIIMVIMMYIIIFSSIYYLIKLYYKKKINSTMFITLFSILLLYRERMIGVIQNLPDYLEFIGKINYIIDDFYKMLGKKESIHELLNKTYSDTSTDFLNIQFKNVSFSYKKDDALIFDHLNITVHTKNKIIGITGLSGKGKSSFVKLILRLYEPTSGKIFIDGKNISSLDPNYIRKNITYVNQNSKLFDKKIIDNITYGCNDINKCNYHLNEIMKYKKISQLYKNIDINNKKAGSLGENLSGGQRQVINIISGLINPSKIIILDEPTNALDKELKNEIISLIHYFRKYKQCIIIITHDNDVYPLFDDTINI